jgi:hypothetical protein
MLRLFNYLKSKIAVHWYNTFFTCLILGFLAWVILPLIFQMETVDKFGIPTSMLGIVCGTIATISGAIVGILTTGIFFIAQYSTSRISEGKTVILKEREYLQSLIRENLAEKGVSKKLIDNLNKIQRICINVTSEVPKEVNWREAEVVTQNTLEMIEKLLVRQNSKLRKLDKKLDESTLSNTSQENMSQDNKKANQHSIRKEDTLKILDDLIDHLSLLFASFPKLYVSLFTLTDVVMQFKKLTVTFAIILVCSLVFLIMSGLLFADNVIFSDSYRLKMAIALLLMFIPSIITMFNMLTVNYKIINILVLGRIKD